MNLIDEDDGSRAVLAGTLGVGHDLLDLFDPGEHSGELDKLRFGQACDDLGQSSFARARRSPEDERAGVIAVDLGAQGLARTNEMLLADELIRRARTHAIGERPSAVGRGIGGRDGLEEAHENKLLALGLWLLTTSQGLNR